MVPLHALAERALRARPHRDSTAGSPPAPAPRTRGGGTAAAFRELVALGRREAPWHPTPADRERVVAAERRLEAAIAGGERVYGTHTGFGADVVRAADGDPRAHQAALLDYLSVGVGTPFPERVVRRALRLQVRKLAVGVSGVSVATWDRLVALGDAELLPRVPRQGSLGASGDLIPMAHAVAPVFATGVPGPRDVLGCVNTNAMMTAWAVEAVGRADRLLARAIRASAWAAEALGADPASSEAAALALADRAWAATGRRLSRARRVIDDAVPAGLAIPVTDAPLQARYSIRCAPEVLGTVAANLAHARRRVVEQAHAVADNPLILEDGRIWHGGLFYALPLATVADLVVDAANRIGELLDRQLLLLVTPPLNHGLPPNLAAEGAGHVKGLHQLATALTQELRGGATLACVRSTSSESHNQDVVPGAMTALHHAHRMLGIAERIAAIATFGAERAVHLRRTGTVPATHTLAAWQRASGRPRRRRR